MSITALSANTIRVIGSTQCLTDPASLVKELLDNSLDAHATAIFVEISLNTIDKIKVRDNGHGIAPEDRNMVCKRYCTSKIRSLKDLYNLGGQSLGFRGEALASAAEMSTRITLTTRVEGESTAMKIEYDRAGLAISEKPTSHAVGTTLEVDNFLSNFPVRKQSVDKCSTKSFSKIKKLLQAYALARPCVRISLKVLKVKNEKGSWSYAPKSGAKNNGTFKLDAAINIFGKKATEQLESYTFRWSSSGELIEPADSRTSTARSDVGNGYVFDFILVGKGITETAPVNNLGQHVSIDDRPVSCGRGILREIILYYKACLKCAVGSSEDRKISDPLLILNITCTKGSYDINVDPAKQDVLFTDAETMLQISRKSLNYIYGEPKDPLVEQPITKHTPEVSGFDVLLARKTNGRMSCPPDRNSPRAASESLMVDVQAKDLPRARPNGMFLLEGNSHDVGLVRSNGDIIVPLNIEDGGSPMAGRKPTWKATMRVGDADDLDLYNGCHNVHQPEIESAPEQVDSRDINLNNPWTLAKIHAPIRSPLRREGNCNDRTTNAYLPIPLHQRGDVTNGSETFSEDHHSPPTSPIPFPYPMKAFGKRQSDDMTTGSPESIAAPSRLSALDSWLHKSSISCHVDSSAYRDDETSGDSYGPHLQSADARNIPTHGIALCDIPDVSQRPRQKPTPGKQRPSTNDKLSTNSRNDPHRVWFEIGEQSHPHRFTKGSRKDKARSNSTNLPIEDENCEFPIDTMHPDLAIILDYEARKAKATRDHRENARREQVAAAARQHAEAAKQRTLESLLGPRTSPPSSNSPHKNRQLKAVAVLHRESDSLIDDSVVEIILPYAGTGKSPSKGASKGLPLEKFIEKDWVLDLILPLSTTQNIIATEMQAAVNWDDYVYTGELINGLAELDAGLLEGWERDIRQLVGKLYQNGDPHVEDGTTLGGEDFVLDLRKGLSTSRPGDL